MHGVTVDGKRFRLHRLAKGLHQRELALLAGVGERTIRNAEAGKRVKIDFLGFLAQALGVELHELVDDRDELREVLRERRRIDLLLEAMAVLGGGDPNAYLDLFGRTVHLKCNGPEGLSFCGEYRGTSGVQALLDISIATLAYNCPPQILNVRTGGNLVVLNGIDRLTAIPTQTAFTMPWMNVYEFDGARIERIDMSCELSILQRAFQPA